MTRRSTNWGPWSKKAANNLQIALGSDADPAPATDPDPLERGRDLLRTTMTSRSTNWGPWSKKAANNLQTAIGSVADPDPDPLEGGRDPDP
jgi:hypothetical protein